MFRRSVNSKVRTPNNNPLNLLPPLKRGEEKENEEDMKNQLTLGEFIALLEECKPDAEIRYDFCDLMPEGIDSYRGYYDQLAIGWTANASTPIVSNILDICKRSIGQTFEGYKGGDYTNGTPLWVANRGQCHSTAIVGVENNNWIVFIETARV